MKQKKQQPHDEALRAKGGELHQTVHEDVPILTTQQGTPVSASIGTVAAVLAVRCARGDAGAFAPRGPACATVPRTVPAGTDVAGTARSARARAGAAARVRCRAEYHASLSARRSVWANCVAITATPPDAVVIARSSGAKRSRTG